MPIESRVDSNSCLYFFGCVGIPLSLVMMGGGLCKGFAEIIQQGDSLMWFGIAGVGAIIFAVSLNGAINSSYGPIE